MDGGGAVFLPQVCLPISCRNGRREDSEDVKFHQISKYPSHPDSEAIVWLASSPA